MVLMTHRELFHNEKATKLLALVTRTSAELVLPVAQMVSMALSAAFLSPEVGDS